MKRTEFHDLFKTPGPAVLPVIHAQDNEQAARNVEIATRGGAAGVFLINHDFGVDPFLPIILHVRDKFPDLWLGVNFLAVTGREAFPILGQLQSRGAKVDAYWADDARIDESRSAADQSEAREILAAKTASGWHGFYTGGTCFKKQREVPAEKHETAARIAAGYMDAVCTSGVATGQAVDLGKIKTFRRAIGDAPLLVASGITPENADIYVGDVDGFMVATGINMPGDFYNIDPARLASLMKLTAQQGANT
jgi:uncharacterized protein